MKLSEILKNVNILCAAANMDTEISGICYDSRQVKKGDLFVAIKGFESDGHRFIPKALEQGAAAVLCQDIPAGCGVYVQTDDCRLALALASREFFGDPASRMVMIGITGTSGKTTTSYLIKHMLEQEFGAKVGLIGTNGIMIGDKMMHSERTTPESYELQMLFRRMADEGCTHLVMEVSSHSLVLDRVAGIRYDVAVYTNLSQDHLDFHVTMEEYAKAKSLLFERCKNGVFNLDDEHVQIMKAGKKCKCLGYSTENKSAELFADNVVLSASGVSFDAIYKGRNVPCHLAIPAMFSVYNALSVIGTGLSLGLSLDQCADALSSAEGVKGRLEIVPTNRDYSVIIDYSHKPDALEKVLKTLKSVTRGRLICLFGCGGDRDRVKRPSMGKIAAENADFVIVTSDNPRTEDPEAIINEILPGLGCGDVPHKVIIDREQAICWALDNAGQGDVILLAGKGHEDYQIVGHEKRHMDEREIVSQHLNK